MNLNSLIVYCVLLATSVTVNAQGWLSKDLSNINVKELTSAQRDEVLRAAKLQGLNESDLEALAKSKGLNVDELKRGQSIAPEASDTFGSNRKNVAENVLQTSVAIYGHELFDNNTLGFAPSVNLAPTVNYVLGPNDRLSIRIYGLQEQTMNLTVSTSGSVIIPYGGKVSLGGLTISEAERVLVSQLQKNGFASLGTGESRLKLQITEFRTIQVMIWGAQQSGAYYLPSLGTAFHALYAAGGPGLNRSYRNIHVIRNGKTIKTIDLYDFLSKGSRSADISLQENDIIFIPFYERRIRLKGEVKTPAVYELLEGEELNAAIDYAGGFTEIAYRDVIDVMRYGDNEKEVYTVRKEDIDSFKLKGAEVVTVNSIADKYVNRIKVQGAVERPGYFSMADSIDMRQAILNAGGLRLNALRATVILFRNPHDGVRSYLTFSLIKIMSGEEKISLEDNDVITIGDSLEMNRNDKVFIFGDVMRSGGFEYGKGLTVSKLLFLAGGFNREALTSKIIVSRKVEDETKLASIFELKCHRDFWKDTALENIELLPGDVVTVARNPYYREQVYVSCEGEFKYPGVYPLGSRKQTLYDLYLQSGGSTSFGDVEGSSIIRQRQVQLPTKLNERLKSKMLNELYLDDNKVPEAAVNISVESASYDTIVLGGSMRKFESTAKQIHLMPGDRFIIPTTENLVRVLGEVYNPNVILYDKSLKLRRYVALAGGATELAETKKIFVIYQNGSSAKTRHFLGLIRIQPEIKSGCQIVVPIKKRKVEDSPKYDSHERIALFSMVATSISTMALVITQILK